MERSDMNLGLPLDQTQKRKSTNWFLSDIEKICRECEILNPPAHIHNILPGEVCCHLLCYIYHYCFYLNFNVKKIQAYHDVGQNPQAASSIGATQHTQISRSCAEDWPVFMVC